MKDIRIQRATASDASALVLLHAACLNQRWETAELEKLLSAEGGKAWLALRANVAVGFLLVRQITDEAEIITFGVIAEERRKGIAHRLMHMALPELKGEGCLDLWLEVAEDNDAARALYEQHGFAHHGRRKEYYRQADGSRKDALTLHKRLTD